ncbi:hypothetical protein ACFWP0_09230 [Achromobacter sp. NPDC058515]|uniref:hypothetical protein n=1 Tax=Achromobacter sp. NPDC058515 TaxID=3346533 RepID=UPI00364CBA7F
MQNNSSKPFANDEAERLRALAEDPSLSPHQHAQIASTLEGIQTFITDYRAISKDYIRLREAVVEFGSAVVPMLEAAVKSDSKSIPADVLATLIKRLLAETLRSTPGPDGEGL